MRILLGLAALVIVLAVVAQLVKSGPSGPPVINPATAPATAPAGPGLRQSPVADEIRRTLDAGAASRASEPER